MLIEVSAKTLRISLGTNCHQELFKGLDNINSGFNLTICRLYKIWLKSQTTFTFPQQSKTFLTQIVNLGFFRILLRQLNLLQHY